MSPFSHSLLIKLQVLTQTLIFHFYHLSLFSQAKEVLEIYCSLLCKKRFLLDSVYRVKPVLRGHLWDKEKVTL